MPTYRIAFQLNGELQVRVVTAEDIPAAKREICAELGRKMMPAGSYTTTISEDN